MPAPGPPPDLQSVRIVVVVVAALCVKYWRLAIRLAVIAVITLVVYGAIEFMQGLHHAAK
jgi:hypothetical protein